MRELTREEKLVATFIEQAQRFPDPAKRRSFAVERAQSGLKCVRSYAEALVDRLSTQAGDVAPAPSAAPAPEPNAVPEGTAVVDERLQQVPPPTPAKVKAPKARTAKATVKKKVDKKK